VDQNKQPIFFGIETRKSVMQATGSSHDLALRRADFSTLCEALDYAAGGETGVNFYNARGELFSATTYRDLRVQALELARKLSGLGSNLAVV